MKYYKLIYSINSKLVGTQFPQVWDFIKGYSPEFEDNGVYSLYYDYNPMFPLVTPNLSGFKLASGAHYTDFLSHGFSNEMFFLSEKAKNYMQDLNIDVHRFDARSNVMYVTPSRPGTYSKILNLRLPRGEEGKDTLF